MGKRLVLLFRLAPLAMLAMVALAGLVVFASPSVGYAQGNKTPGKPTIQLFGCTNGCIAVDVSVPTAFEEGGTFDFKKYWGRRQVYQTTNTVQDTSKCETVTHRYFDYKGDPNPKVTTGIGVGVGEAAPGLGDDLPDWVRAAASKAIPVVWDAGTNAYKLPSLTGDKDKVRVWDIYPKRYSPTDDEETARQRYRNDYCVHPDTEIPEQRLIVEMQWRNPGDTDWQNWRLQQGPAYTGVRFQSLTRRGQFEVRNLEYNTAYQVRARIHHRPYEDNDGHYRGAATVGAWSDVQTITTKDFPEVDNFRMVTHPEGVTLSWDNPSDDPGFDGYFVAVNANGQCECGVTVIAGETWADWVTGTSVTVKGFNPGQTVQACIRPAIGSRGGNTQRSAYKTIGWPADAVAGAPGAPTNVQLGYGEMFGSNIAPAYDYAGEVDLWDHYADIGDVPTQYPPLLDWDRLYITWDRAPQNGAYVTDSEWEFRTQGSSDWQHGGRVSGHKRRWGEMGKQFWENSDTIATRYFGDGQVYEFRVRSRSSAGWGPWSEVAELLNYTKRGIPGQVRDLRVAQPVSSHGAGQWFIRWAHPEWTGAYIQHNGAWGPASIKTYEVTVTQPGRSDPLRIGGPPETSVRPDGTLVWNLGTAATCRADGLANGFFYPCSHERVGFEMWFEEVPDLSKPVVVTVRAQNNSAHQGWSVTEIEYTPVGPPSAITNLQVVVDETDARDGVPTGLHRMSWDAPADDGGSPLHYMFNYDCVVLGGDEHNEHVADLFGGLYGATEHNVRNPELSRNRPGTLRCEWIEIYPRNAHFFSGPVVRWTAPPKQVAPYLINPVSDIHIPEGSGWHEIDLSNVYHDPNGDDFTITREVSADDEPYVQQVSEDRILRVNAPKKVGDCEIGKIFDQNGTRTCWLTNIYHVTVYADDGNRNYGEGGRTGPHRFRVVIDEKPEVLTFNPLVYDGVDLDGDGEIDTERDGRIDRREFQKVKDDYAACVDTGLMEDGTTRKPPGDATRYRIEGSFLQCNTGEIGHPYSNFLMMKALFERTNVKVTLMWNGEAESDLSVPESGGAVNLKARLWEPAPVDITLTIHHSPGNVGDFTLSANKITILKGETETSVAHDSVLTIADDSDAEGNERFIILVSGTIDGCTPPASGPNTCAVAGDAVLEIEDNEIGIDLKAPNPMELQPGASATYTIALVSKPTDLVVISARSPTQFVEVTGSRTISANAWNQPVTFTVTASGDIPAAGLPLQGVRIAHTVSSLDTNYDGLSAPDVWMSVVAPPQKQSPVNHAPTVANAIADIDEIAEGERQLILLGNVFAYEGNGALTISAGSSDDTKATVSVSPDGSSVTVTAVAAGTATITVMADDPDGDRAIDEFDVTVIGPSQQHGQGTQPATESPPAVSDTGPVPVGNLQCVAAEDRIRFSWDIPEWSGGELKSYDVDLTLPNGSRIAERRHWTLRSQTDRGNWEPGTEARMAVTAVYHVDGEGRVFSSETVKTCVVPGDPNNAPTVASALADATIVNEAGSYRVLLTGVFADSDNDSLTTKAKSSDTDVAAAAVNGNALTVTAKKRGTATITVTASDGKAQVSDAFTVTVKGTPTVATAFPDITGLEIDDTRTVPLSSRFSDPDEDALTYNASSSSTSVVVINVSIDGTSSSTVVAMAAGTATITVTAEDSDGNSVSDSFDVTVNAAQQQQQQHDPPPKAEPPNNVPTVENAITDATIVKTSGTHDVALSNVFADADSDNLTITAESSSASVATVSVAADYSSLTVTAKARGTTTITVTASDGSATVKDKFDVTVKSAPAVASAIPDMPDLVVGQLPDPIDLTKVFSDADGDTLTFSASSTNDDVAWGTPFHGTLNVVPVAIGTVTFTVTAEDSDENSVSDSFHVTVVNSPPTVANAISDATIASETGTKQVSLSGVFDDVDYHTLTMTAKSSDTAVATVAVSQNTLKVTAKKRGTATITVTANDGNGGSVEDSFTVTVKAAPVVASAIADVSGLVIGDEHEVSVSGVFSDADGDALTISATTSDSTVVQVSNTIDPSTGSATAITVTGVDAGTATITVTARDSDGNSVNDEFNVTVPAAEQQQQAVELPGPVVSLELTATAENSVIVRWSAPETGGAPDGYIVHLRPENGEKGSGKTKRPKAKKTQVKFNNLESGQTYQVWVRAQNEAGKGERVHASITLPE